MEINQFLLLLLEGLSNTKTAISKATLMSFPLAGNLSERTIPDAVYNEVVIKGKGEIGSEDTETAIKDGWILKRTINDEVADNALTMS